MVHPKFVTLDHTDKSANIDDDNTRLAMVLKNRPVLGSD